MSAQVCQDHWDGLRVRIADRGLGVLVSVDGAEAARRAAAMQDEGVTVDNFEPLVHGFIDLVSLMGAAMGPRIATFEGCPLCFLNGHEPGLGDRSLDIVSDKQVAMWESLRSPS